MSAPTTPHAYTIAQAATLTGLPATTLRYYESVGIIPPVSRGASSGHRVYDDEDLDRIMGVACLAATGMSVGDMRSYVANGGLGPSAASEQVALLTEQQLRLQHESRQLALRQQYVALKIEYWQCVAGGDDSRAEALATEARALADRLQRASRP